jgi:PAS domain S-box-containing protein
MYGWSEAEALPMNIRDITPPGKTAELVDLILRLVAGETIASFETQRLTKDGRILDIWLTATALRDKDKKTTVAIATTERDITGRKKAEKELRESEEKFRATYEQAAVGIEQSDLQGRFITGNGKLSDILGYSEEELRHLTFMQITQHEDLRIETPLLEQLIAGQIPNYSLEKRYIHKDGHSIWVRVTSSIAKIENPYRISIIEDITERKKAEEELLNLTEELRRSNAELEQFAYAASHDMREPLRTITGFLKLLERRYKGKLDEKADEYISFTIDSVTRMDMVLKDLLEFSRLGAKAHHMKPLNCSVALEQALYNLRSTIEESGAEITYDLLPTVMANESQIASLFQNLLSNSIKFRGKGKLRIHVSAEQKDNQWVFSVQDNGIGIDPKFFDRIFVIFRRLHTRQEYEGTGIGLAICKKIVELHGGRIWVESESGEGATFYFTLPVLDIPPKH